MKKFIPFFLFCILTIGLIFITALAFCDTTEWGHTPDKKLNKISVALNSQSLKLDELNGKLDILLEKIQHLEYLLEEKNKQEPSYWPWGN